MPAASEAGSETPAPLVCRRITDFLDIPDTTGEMSAHETRVVRRVSCGRYYLGLLFPLSPACYYIKIKKECLCVELYQMDYYDSIIVID